jgi:hypothetical protein
MRVSSGELDRVSGGSEVFGHGASYVGGAAENQHRSLSTRATFSAVARFHDRATLLAPKLEICAFPA